jgi:hypothetical protein
MANGDFARNSKHSQLQNKNKLCDVGTLRHDRVRARLDRRQHGEELGEIVNRPRELIGEEARGADSSSLWVIGTVWKLIGGREIALNWVAFSFIPFASFVVASRVNFSIPPTPRFAQALSDRAYGRRGSVNIFVRSSPDRQKYVSTLDPSATRRSGIP